MTEAPSSETQEPSSARVVSAWELFSGFALVGLMGFGGIAAAIYHVVIERRKWLTADEYASTLGLGQVLPGANLINLTTMIGDRFQGTLGAAIALSGLMLTPIVTLIALASLYDRFSYLQDVRTGITAAAAGAVGLTFGTGIKLARRILKTPTALAVGACSFVAIGLLNFPILWTMLVLAPLTVAIEVWREAK